MKNVKIAAITMFLVALPLLPAEEAFAEYNTVTGREEDVLVSTEKEIEMGASISRQIEKRYPPVDDKHMQERVNLVGQRLADNCDRKEIIYHFKVLDIDDINAFAVPGGWVYVFKGLVEECENDDELAGVIAHEVGHIAARHSVKRMQKSIASSIAMILVAATQGGEAARATDLAITSLMMAYSREDEFEADRRAVRYTKAAGYDPNAIVTFIESMKEAKKFDIRPYSYFRSHPYTGERIGVVNREITGQTSFNDWINRPIDR